MSITNTVTELDFDQLKSDIIEYIKTNPSFTDYAFEGSALNAIADILAFNTHNLAYYANMLHGEGFLDSAQKRSSVVSRAKELGYVPRSAVCSAAYVTMTVYGVPVDSPVPQISRGLSFNSLNDNGSYGFYSVEDRSPVLESGNYIFNNLKLVSGTEASNKFTVNTLTNVRSIFTIPNKYIDTSTLKVFIKESAVSVARTEYTLAENVYEVTAESKVYFLQESYDGFFQIYFGENVLGYQPVNDNQIEVSYFVAKDLALPNGCRTFKANFSLGTATSTNIVTSQMSFGGSDKETIDSVKKNAVKSNSAKERAVTSNDYVLLLKERFNYIRSAAVWGGEDNVPPVYGKVFISVQSVDGYTITDTVKQSELLPAVKSACMMTVVPEFVDPSYTHLEFTTRIKFNSQKTMSTKISVESAIKAAIISHVQTISSYNQDYLESKLASIIGALDPGIASVDIDKRIGFRISPILNVDVAHSKAINNAIISGTISSTKFKSYYDNLETTSIKELPNQTSTLAKLGLYSDSGVLIKEIGTVDLVTGKFDFVFNAYAYISELKYISISFEAVSDDITTKRNQILVLNTDVVDPTIGLSSNNAVVTELYGK